ncbi:uncharacterized protein LOC116020891 [Ipomoea triloba]|uniref:uncharacterized protein LOC116020891 n=1 Tax=Ipomoea triloba TaxID=35885 RepID=UPI00125D5E60|nr:uncharacterized protein LOC116020891 [Ipomoea triloba]
MKVKEVAIGGFSKSGGGSEDRIQRRKSPVARSSRSSSEYTKMIKIHIGNMELPVSPGVLDDLMERSKNGEGDMEILLSKHVMGEISKAIKRKTGTMIDRCKLETEFAKEVETRIEELSKPLEAENQENVIVEQEKGVESESKLKEKVESKVDGVMKPKEYRDYVIPEKESKEYAKEGMKHVTVMKGGDPKASVATGMETVCEKVPKKTERLPPQKGISKESDNINKKAGEGAGGNVNRLNNQNVGRKDAKQGQPGSSYASLFSKDTAKAGVSVLTGLAQPEIKENMTEMHRGLPAISFEETEIKQLNIIENHLLIGKFSWGRPSLEDIRRYRNKKPHLGKEYESCKWRNYQE